MDDIGFDDFVTYVKHNRNHKQIKSYIIQVDDIERLVTNIEYDDEFIELIGEYSKYLRRFKCFGSSRSDDTSFCNLYQYYDESDEYRHDLIKKHNLKIIG